MRAFFVPQIVNYSPIIKKNYIKIRKVINKYTLY